MNEDTPEIPTPQDGHAVPFARLTPEVVLDAVESLSFHADGRLMALNSYENRVYRVGLELPAGAAETVAAPVVGVSVLDLLQPAKATKTAMSAPAIAAGLLDLATKCPSSLGRVIREDSSH